jgi:hypothetical protein
MFAQTEPMSAHPSGERGYEEETESENTVTILETLQIRVPKSVSDANPIG